MARCACGANPNPNPNPNPAPNPNPNPNPNQVFPQPLRSFLELPAQEEAPPEQPMMMQATLEPSDTVILVAYVLPLVITPKASGGGYDIEWNVDAVLNKVRVRVS